MKHLLSVERNKMNQHLLTGKIKGSNFCYTGMEFSDFRELYKHYKLKYKGGFFSC